MKSIVPIIFWAFTSVFALFGVSASGAAKVAPPEQFFPIYDYQNDWLVYNDQYKNYVPFSQSVNEGIRYVSLYIDVIKNRRYALLLKTENESYLFIEGALQKKIELNSWQKLDLDSLYRIYKKDELLLTVYGSPGIEDKTLLLCNEKQRNDHGVIENAGSNLINIKPIEFTPFGNFAVLSMFIILILNAWIFNVNPLSFSRLINPLEFFNDDPREQLSKLNKPYSNNIIFFVVIISMLMSFVIIFFSTNKQDLFSLNMVFSDRLNTIQLLRDFFILSTILFLLMYVKYILMVLAGNMLNLDKVVDNLFIKIVQSSYLFYVAVFLVVFMLSFNHITWIIDNRPYILIPFLFFYIARSVALYVVTKPVGSFINLYLFSYLCVIEIIPLIVSIKFAI